MVNDPEPVPVCDTCGAPAGILAGGLCAACLFAQAEASMGEGGEAGIERIASQGTDRYRVGEVIAQGGMGTILAATELTTRRTVAMKVMRPEAAGSEQGRFLREARLTARLEHPNIVPVHEVGQDAQGRAFYTMKLVRGRTLRSVLEQLATGDPAIVREFPLRQLLAIFARICDGVAFAHASGAMHRDLKPENIMLGDFGEVLVMDWGLAKLLSPSGTESAEEIYAPRDMEEGEGPRTLAGAVMGTPQFMAPEQAEGRIAEIDRRTDIFALGAILYNVLTLEPPVRGETAEEILGKIRSGDSGRIPAQAARPGQRLPHCPGGRVPEALSAVAARALSQRPGDRYQTVGALQQEITAYLGGFATVAEAAGLPRQITLLLGRHKSLTASILASLLLLAAISGVYLWRVVASERRAVAARKSADELIHYMQYDLRETLAKLGQLKMMDGINQRVRAYQRAFPAAAGDLEGLRETANALDQQGGLLKDRGEPLAALKVYQEAQEIRQRALQKDPGSAEWLRDVGVSGTKVGGVRLDQRQFAQALAAFTKAREVSEQLLQREPGNERYQRDLSTCLDSIGDTLDEQGALPEAERSYQASVQISEKLAEANPTSAERRRDLAIGYEKLGAVQQKQGKLAEALEAFLRDQKISAELATDDAEDMGRQRDLSISLQRVSDVRRSLGLLAEALSAGEESRRICERLVKHDPENADWQRDRYVTYDLVGDVLQLQERWEEALAAYQAGSELTRGLAARDPANTRWQDDLAYWLHKLAPVLEKLGRREDGRSALREASRIDEQLLARDPTHALAQERLKTARAALQKGPANEAPLEASNPP